MRTRILLSATALLWSTAAFAQQAGDRVVVTARPAQLRTLTDIVGSVPQGNILTVKDVNDTSFFVTYSSGRATTKGWINRQDVLPVKESLEFFNAELQRTPTSEFSAIRGRIRTEMNEYDKGIADRTWIEIGDLDKAITDWNEAIRLDATYSKAYLCRGVTWYYKGDCDKSVADLKEAILLDSTDAYSYCALAWIYAICPDDKFRDGKRSVELATKACELTNWKEAYIVCSLAAAYAEAGDFQNAVKWQVKCLSLSSESDKKEWGFLLKLFRSGKPYRDGRQQFRFGNTVRHSAAGVA